MTNTSSSHSTSTTANYVPNGLPHAGHCLAKLPSSFSKKSLSTCCRLCYGYHPSLTSRGRLDVMGRPQSVVNSPARLVFRRRRYDHVSDALSVLHWLRAYTRTDRLQAGGHGVSCAALFGSSGSNCQPDRTRSSSFCRFPPTANSPLPSLWCWQAIVLNRCPHSVEVSSRRGLIVTISNGLVIPKTISG